MPNDNVEIIAGIEPLKGSENYASWKQLMTSYLKSKRVWKVVSGETTQPQCEFGDVKPIAADVSHLVPADLTDAQHQRAVADRLATEVQKYERLQKWSKDEAEAYQTILRHLHPQVSIHVAGLDSSKKIWDNIERRYTRKELATYCELFAQLTEAKGSNYSSIREFVDQINLLVERLNAIDKDSITNKVHISFLLNQVGPQYSYVVDAIQNDEKVDDPIAVGTRLANAERTVDLKESATLPKSVNAVRDAPKCTHCKKRGHIASRCWIKYPHMMPKREDNARADRKASGSPNSNTISHSEDREGPSASKRRKVTQ